MSIYKPKVILLTGAAKRVGAAIARFLHQQGMRIIIHYHHSAKPAEDLCAELNAARENSAFLVAADLSVHDNLAGLIDQAVQKWGYLDGLINNASTFFPTQMGNINETDWNQLIDVNLKAPFFLTQLAAPWLKHQRGIVINITDIHAQKPLKNYPVYSIAKAGLEMMTQALAKELAPDIRVNGIAPGIMLWSTDKNYQNEVLQKELTSRIALKKIGDPLEIAKAALYFIESGDYVTGQTLAVDGGRLLNC